MAKTTEKRETSCSSGPGSAGARGAVCRTWILKRRLLGSSSLGIGCRNHQGGLAMIGFIYKVPCC
jgi:hypothetical protein